MTREPGDAIDGHELEHRLRTTLSAVMPLLDRHTDLLADESSEVLDLTSFEVERNASSMRRARSVVAGVSLVAATVAALVVIVQREPVGGPVRDGVSTIPTSAPKGPTASTAAPVGSLKPLGLTAAPAGMALVNQAVRPAGAEPIHAVVLVKRDEQNVVTERVLVRLGHTGLYGPTAGTVPAPSNLPTATSGNVSYDRSNRMVRIEFALGALGNFSLEAYHSDQSSNNALRDELQDIAGAFTIWPGGDIRVSSQLPDGWTLAAAGLQPEQVVPSYFQAFETNTADGAPQIIIDNRTIDDPAFPYWEMYQTLQPVEIRGQAGFVTTQAFEIDSRTSTDTMTARTLIWEETPGLWVTLWVAHLTTEQAVAVANNLVAIAPDEWSMSAPPTTSAATTRTST